MKKNRWQDRYKDYDHYMWISTYNPQSNHDGSYLDFLIGKMVTIYRGGPESRSGKLLDVQSDYMTLYTPNKAVIYYQSEHVKSISEDIKSNSTQHLLGDQEKVDYISKKNFNGLLSKLVNEAIQINQGGPERRHGTLLAVRCDFLILLTEDDGVVYVKLHHIKSVSKTGSPEDKKDEKKPSKNPVFSKASYFSDVFKELKHKWVTINRGGPEAMEGILVEKSGGFYTLITDHAVLRIHPFHIRSVSSGPKGSKKHNKDENKDDNKDGKENAEKQSSKDKNKDGKENAKKQGSKDKNKDGKENAKKQSSKDKNKDGKENAEKQSSKDKNKDGKEKLMNIMEQSSKDKNKNDNKQD